MSTTTATSAAPAAAAADLAAAAAVLHAGITHLAAVCDYAEERDGKGFSATDAGIGHFLAELNPTRWEQVHVVTARAVLPTYRRQLGPELTTQVLAIPTSVDDDEIAESRSTVRGQGRAARERQYRARNSYVALELEEGRVRVGFPYNGTLVAQSRAIPGRRYDGQTRSNTYPLSSLPAVIGFATQADIPVDPEILAVAKDVVANPAAYRPVAVTCDPQDPTILVIDTDFDPDLNEALRTINGGSTWAPASRVHRIDATAGPTALRELFTTRDLRMAADAQAALHAAAAAPADHSGTVSVADRWTVTITPAPGIRDILGRQLRQLAGGVLSRRDVWAWPLHVEPQRVLDLLDEHHLIADDDARTALVEQARTQTDNLAASIARTGPRIDVPGLGVTLLSHQHPAVRYAMTRRRLIIGDEMGLGKTITSCAAVAAANAFPLIVACKPDLTENWRSEVSRILPGRSVTVAAGMKPAAPPDGTDVVIIGYAALGSRQTQGRSETFPWVVQLTALAPRALIIDEGHLGKEVTAARSRAMAALGRAIVARDGLIMNLTGTAVVNRPRELAQQLITLGVLAPKGARVQPGHLFGEEGAFLFRYCGPQQNTHGWTFTGASHTAELHHRLRAWGLFLRRGEDAVVDLPDFDRVALTIPIEDLDPAALTEYRAAERAAANDFAVQARELADQMGVGVGDPRVRAAMRGHAGDHLTRLNELRQILGRAKQPAVARWVRVQIDAGEKVLIAAHHREVVDAYAGLFGGLKIQGGQSALVKEDHKARFQNDPQTTAPAITVSIGAGGVGHTLTAARLGIQAELCWTPGELRQMSKRIHRIGQTRPVTYSVAVATNTIDDSMWSMILDKQQVLDAVLDGIETDDTDDTASAAAQLAWQLTQTGLTRIDTRTA